MPPAVREQLNHLREDHKKMITAAEEAGRTGDDGAKKFKMMLAGEIMDKIKEIEDKHPQDPPPSLPPPMLLPPPPLLGARPPAIVPPPGGMPPPSIQDMQRMMTLYQNPDMAQNVTLQRALEYEQEKANSSNMEPEVIELAHHFNLTDRHARMLDEQLKKRNNTYEDDIAAMYEILKGAKNPADLLMVSIRWMSEGVFRGTLTPNPDVEKT